MGKMGPFDSVGELLPVDGSDLFGRLTTVRGCLCKA